MKVKDNQQIRYCTKCKGYTIHEFGHDDFVCFECDFEKKKPVKTEKKILNILTKIIGKRKKENLTRYFMRLGCYVLGVSAVLDLALWFLIGYLVPSWTIAVMSLMNMVFIWFLRGKLK